MKKVVFRTSGNCDSLEGGTGLQLPVKIAFLYTNETYDLKEVDLYNYFLSDYSGVFFVLEGLDFIKDNPGGKLYEIGPIKPGEEDVIREKYEK